jgi:hypothetical protein
MLMPSCGAAALNNSLTFKPKNVELNEPETAIGEGLANQLHISGNFTFFKGAAMRASTAAGPMRDFYLASSTLGFRTSL